MRMRREARKGVCEALEAIEEEYFGELLSSYENLREGVLARCRKFEQTRRPQGRSVISAGFSRV